MIALQVFTIGSVIATSWQALWPLGGEILRRRLRVADYPAGLSGQTGQTRQNVYGLAASGLCYWIGPPSTFADRVSVAKALAGGTLGVWDFMVHERVTRIGLRIRAVFGFSSDLAIDLGTSNTLVFVKGRGIVVNEPSIVALESNSRRLLAVGRGAKEMLGRTPASIVTVRPMSDGVIADFDVAEVMLKYFIGQAHSHRRLLSPRVVIGIPSEITQVERRAVVESALRAKAGEVYLVEQAVAAGIGAGLPITEPRGSMIVDVGGGTTGVAVISSSGVVYCRSVRVAGNEMDDAIVQSVRRRHNLLIGERTAENIKIELGSAEPLDRPLTMEIKGRDFIRGVPKTITITNEEVREALGDTVEIITNAVKVALERTPPELSADIMDRGIVLTGGGALLRRFDKRLAAETGLHVSVAEDPLSSVVLGASRLLTDPDLLRRVRVQ